jgi:uncharacterized protein (UPF0212 family)
MTKFLTLTKAADIMGCSRHHVRHLLERGLPYVDISMTQRRCPRIPQDQLEAWLRGKTIGDGAVVDPETKGD